MQRNHIWTENRLQFYTGPHVLAGCVFLLLRHNTDIGTTLGVLQFYSAATVFFLFPILYFIIGIPVIELLNFTQNSAERNNVRQKVSKVSRSLSIWLWPAILILDTFGSISGAKHQNRQTQAD